MTFLLTLNSSTFFFSRTIKSTKLPEKVQLLIVVLLFCTLFSTLCVFSTNHVLNVQNLAVSTMLKFWSNKSIDLKNKNKLKYNVFLLYMYCLKSVQVKRTVLYPVKSVFLSLFCVLFLSTKN